MDNNWLKDEILIGLAKMLSLRLDGSPPDDAVKAAASTWIEAITDGMAWNQERDTSRIRKAFVTLERTRERWPAPTHFLAALPAPVQPRLAHQRRPVDPETAKSNIAQLRAQLSGVGRGDQPTGDAA